MIHDQRRDPLPGRAPMTGTNAAKGIPDLLAEVLKAFGKDGIGQLMPARVVQGVPAEGAFCAYDALDSAAKTIADRVLERIGAAVTPPVPVVLQAGDDMSDLLEYRSLVLRLDDLATTLKDATAKAQAALSGGGLDWDRLDRRRQLLAITPGVVALAGNAAAAAIALIGAVARQTTTEQHGNVAITDADLIAAVAKAMPADRLEALRPSTLALRAAQWAAGEGRLIKRLEALDDDARTLRRAIAEVEARLAPKPAAPAPPPPPAAADLVAQLTEILGAGGPAAVPDPAAQALRAAKADGEAVLGAFDAAWAIVPAALPRLVRADAMEHVLGSGGLVLGLRVLVANGGTLRRESGFWLTRKVEEDAFGNVLVAFTLTGSAAPAVESGRIPGTARKRLEAPSA